MRKATRKARCVDCGGRIEVGEEVLFAEPRGSQFEHASPETCARWKARLRLAAFLTEEALDASLPDYAVGAFFEDERDALLREANGLIPWIVLPTLERYPTGPISKMGPPREGESS